MTKLTWGTVGKRYYETGVDRGVLYVGSNPGVAWHGLTSITESPSGGEIQSFYLDGINYVNISSDEVFEATIEAFTYPDEFEQCDGSIAVFSGLYVTQQPRKPFGLAYRSMIGNDLDGHTHAYKIHLVYNALATPTQHANNTIDDSTNLTPFSWKITSYPTSVAGYKHSAHFVIDSRTTNPPSLAAIEDILYGSELTEPRLPLPAELFSIFESFSDFVVVDNGDGTFTVTGSDDYIQMINETTFQITWPNAVFIDEDTYTISSSAG